MTNQQVLTKAIEKAIAGGWSSPSHEYRYKSSLSGDDRIVVFRLSNTQFIAWPLMDLLTNHDFAKALWGEKEKILHGAGAYADAVIQPTWQYHLQQMVISPDPIKYLGENL